MRAMRRAHSTVSSHSVSLSMDPKLRGGNSCLLLRLLGDEPPRDSERETIEKWTTDKEIEVSSSNRMRTMDEEIKVLVEAKAIFTDLHALESFQTEITQREAERSKLELTLLKAVALKKMNKIEALQDEKDGLEILLEEQKESKNTMEVHLTVKQRLLLAAKDQRIGLLNTHVLSMAAQLRQKESEMKRKLMEKEMLMDLARKKDQADKLKLKEAHKLECDALRLQLHLEQAEGRHEPFSTEGYIQTEIQQVQLLQAGIIRPRDNGENVVQDVQVGQQGCGETVSGQEERKSKILRGINSKRKL